MLIGKQQMVGCSTDNSCDKNLLTNKPDKRCIVTNSISVQYTL